jgi:hypothetical protein
MKKNLALILLVIITTVSFGQNSYQDVVYLKNGSIIRGIIIEQIPNKSIKIETADRSVFVFRIDEIEKLTKEPIQWKSGGSFRNSDIQSGYKGIAEVGYDIGTGNYGMDRLKLYFINGYQVNPYFSLGCGTGLQYYFDAEAALIPIFADFRVHFMDNKVSPYLSLGVGYSFDATNSFKGVGFLLIPTMGVSFKVSEKSAMNIGLGYEIQRMKFIYYDWYYYDESMENSGAASINVGISF